MRMKMKKYYSSYLGYLFENRTISNGRLRYRCRSPTRYVGFVKAV